MAKSDVKTVPTELEVSQFIAAVDDVRRRDDAQIIDALFRRITGEAPQMWGPSIIGYGSYAYKYESGREGVSLRAGFSPRKAALTIYHMASPAEQPDGQALFAQLGKHSKGKGCLYVKRLADVDMAVLEQLVALSWRCMNEAYAN